MKRIFVLMILTLFLSVSAAFAADNVSVSDDVVAMSEVEETQAELSNSTQSNQEDFLSADAAAEDSVLEASSQKECADKLCSNSSEATSNSTVSAVVYPAKLTSNNIVSTYGKTVTFKVKVLDSNGNALKKKLVTFKVAGKTYKVNTTSYGNAKIKLKLNAGTYNVKYYCGNLSGSKKVTFKNYYKITVYKWKTGANVKKNKKIKNNIPDSALVRKIVKYAKKGTPVIKFKGGKGKIVFITAGVHGNELSSQIAAMKLIKYLASHPIKGTVYVMPFMNPKATAKNVRNYNINLNAYANVKGTVSYKTVKLITKAKCNFYGDFHCTKPGGDPGKNVAMGSYNPTYKSATMAKYIAKKSNVKYLIYNRAGVEYPGAMEDAVNLKHIPAVTCEALTPHGKIAKGSVGISLSMMKSLLKFASVL